MTLGQAEGEMMPIGKHFLFVLVFLIFSNGLFAQDGAVSERDSLIIDSIKTALPEISQNARLMAAFSLVDGEKYELALKELDIILEKDASNKMALTFQGICYQKLNQCDKAMKSFDQVLELDPQNADVRFLIGKCHLSNAEPEKAESSFKDALYYDNQYSKAKVALAKLYLERNEIAKAKEIIGEESDLRRMSFSAQYTLAQIYLYEKDTSRVLEILSNILKYRPYHEEGLKLRVQIYELQDNKKGLISDLTTLMEAYGKSTSMLFKRAKLNFELNKWVSSLVDLNDVIYYEDSHAEAYFYRSICRARLYDAEGACLDIEKASECGFECPEQIQNILCK